jgi:hypothetical protein
MQSKLWHVHNISIESLLTLGGGPLYKDANLNPYWSHVQDPLPHFLALLSPLPSPKHPLFPPLIHTCEHLLTTTTSTCLNLLLLGTITQKALKYKYFLTDIYFSQKFLYVIIYCVRVYQRKVM